MAAPSLHQACGDGDLALVRELLEQEPLINQTDNSGRTPLFCASREGHTASDA